MDLYIHYTELPQGKELADIVGELNEVLDEHGAVCGGAAGRIDLDLEDERINPKYASTWTWRTSASTPSTPRSR